MLVGRRKITSAKKKCKHRKTYLRESPILVAPLFSCPILRSMCWSHACLRSAVLMSLAISGSDRGRLNLTILGGVVLGVRARQDRRDGDSPEGCASVVLEVGDRVSIRLSELRHSIAMLLDQTTIWKTKWGVILFNFGSIIKQSRKNAQTGETSRFVFFLQNTAIFVYLVCSRIRSCVGCSWQVFFTTKTMVTSLYWSRGEWIRVATAIKFVFRQKCVETLALLQSSQRKCVLTGTKYAFYTSHFAFAFPQHVCIHNFDHHIENATSRTTPFTGKRTPMGNTPALFSPRCEEAS